MRTYPFTLKNREEIMAISNTALNYCYDSGSDRLLSYNGEIFEYDEIGNPTTYRGKSAAWAYGRQLQSFDGNTYTYDARGRRISKQHGTDEPIHFTYDSNGRLIQQSNGLEFIYDHTGVMGVIYNGSTYFYRKNAQNDVISLLDKQGNVVVKYTYDAWGNNTVTMLDASATTIANLNPFRYRSYYYDTETNLYFLKTRYYDPEVARFMTIDGITYLNPDAVNGLNLYAYCVNNPVNSVDSNGCFGLAIGIIATCAILGGLIGAFSAATTDGNIAESFVEGVITGAIGATCGLILPSGAAIIVATGLGIVVDIAFQLNNRERENNSDDIWELDIGRAIKIGCQTGLGTMVPCLGAGAGNCVDAIGTALIWIEAAVLIAVSDIIITNASLSSHKDVNYSEIISSNLYGNNLC